MHRVSEASMERQSDAAQKLNSPDKKDNLQITDDLSAMSHDEESQEDSQSLPSAPDRQALSVSDGCTARETNAGGMDLFAASSWFRRVVCSERDSSQRGSRMKDAAENDGREERSRLQLTSEDVALLVTRAGEHPGTLFVRGCEGYIINNVICAMLLS